VNNLQNQKQILSDQAADIEKARDEAVQANAYKSNFLANMSHEIRTPLTSIIGFAESCSETDCSVEDRTRAVNTIIRSGKHLVNLINEILDLSKVEAGKLEINASEVNIIDLLEEINQLFTVSSQEKGLIFGVNYAFPLPHKIIIDPLRLKQILLNLCANAIKFTQQGYVYLNVAYDKENNKLNFEVIDTGIGMKQDQLKRIFKPFEQADSSITRKYGGTGLGLTLSKQLTEILGGTLTVKSKLNKGSSFKVSITPNLIDASDFVYEKDLNILAETHNLADYKLPQLNGKILIAEDNDDIRELVKLIIKKIGLIPEIVENGKMAVERAAEKEFDIIFLDIQMPVMDGISAVKELRKQGYTRPIVAMTANAMQKDRNECRAAGFDDFISKPIDRRSLYKVIFEYIKPVSKKINGDRMLTSDLLAEDPDLIDLIDKFMRRLPEMQSAINQSYNDKNWEVFSGLIHQMKGVGGGYGYPMLTDLCANLEVQLKNQSMDNVAKLMNEFNELAEQILAGSEENHKIANKA
jgi:CheY-like chemotaxis protein